MNHDRMVWTKEKDAQLKLLVAEGKASYTTMSETLRCLPSTVSARVKLLGLKYTYSWAKNRESLIPETATKKASAKLTTIEGGPVHYENAIDADYIPSEHIWKG